MAKTVEELQAELAALKSNYDAQQATLKTYSDEQSKLVQYQSEATLLKGEVNRLREDSVKRTVKEKSDGLKIPALRDTFVSLYTLAISQPTKVKHYNVTDKKESDVDLTTVLDSMVAHLNEKISPMLKTYSKNDEKKDDAQADNFMDAGKEIDRLVREHMTANKVDYSAAFLAVQHSNPELAKTYATATN
jgi:hypothetical protein